MASGRGDLHVRDRGDIKSKRNGSPQIIKKKSFIQRLFSMNFKTDESDADFQAYRKHSNKRRHTVQVDKSFTEQASLATDSDEAMMAKASADCLLSPDRDLFLSKPRPCSTNSSPTSRHSRTRISAGRSGQKEVNGNDARYTKQRIGAGSKSSQTNSLLNSSPSQQQGRFHSKLQRHYAGSNVNTGAGGGGGGKFKSGGSFKRRSMKMSGGRGAGGGGAPTTPKVDATRPLVFPNTPETILEYHKQKPILDENEEWLVVELNEYECLVDNLPILKIIAKHSKFFEVEPDELWQEFFDFVDELPSYDEVINFDVWQEFRDKRYSC